jgi:dihydrofolate reductase
MQERAEEVAMRQVVAALFVSLDGVAESPDKWQFEHFDDAMMAEMASQIAEQDAVLLGRVTFQEWAQYWPTSTDEPLASFINDTPKYVISTTLEEPLEWNNSTVIGGEVAEAVAALKREVDGDILVNGSVQLVRTLMEHDLVDEYRLMVFPTVLGAGKRLFGESGEAVALRLVDAKPAGETLILIYEPGANEAGDA